MSNGAIGHKWRKFKKWFADNRSSGTFFIMTGTLVLGAVALIVGYGLSSGWDVVLGFFTGEYGGWCWILYIGIVIWLMLLAYFIYITKMKKGSKNL